jgi:S-DNA-T family DNA segregation ATPase FtsK/SpoIIIE
MTEETQSADLIRIDIGDGYSQWIASGRIEEAACIIISERNPSVSLLRRRMQIPFPLAEGIMKYLEESKIVGPFPGTKAREILVKNIAEAENILKGRME